MRSGAGGGELADSSNIYLSEQGRLGGRSSSLHSESGGDVAGLPGCGRMGGNSLILTSRSLGEARIGWTGKESNDAIAGEDPKL